MRSRRLARAAAALLTGALVLLFVSAANADTQAATSTYIVQMLDQPAVAYTGGIAGLPATKPGKGRKIDPTSPAVVGYVSYLESQHDEALQKVGGGQKLYDYAIAFDGVAAKLTDVQAAALEKQDGVVAATKDELDAVDTSSTPTFLGLTDSGGLWQQLGGKADGSAGGKNSIGPGENVVIGDIDSGIWPESQSFSDRDLNGKLVYQNIPHRNFKCTNGERFSASMCNEKLIGARYFDAAWGGNAGIDAKLPWEFDSPRDYNGHGTSTASIAAGNNGVPTSGPASVFGPISGMAPRARIAVYKALWSTQDGSSAGGFTSDLVAAIDQAVSDGVDVINYSVAGTTTNFLDPVQVAFLFAADAGVFVAASAGNNGPTTGTVEHPGPWLTTVAAGTHDRSGQGSVTLGNGVTYVGASVATKVGPAPLVDATAAGVAGADTTRVAFCFAKVDNGGAAVLDPAKVAGKIVVCDRGLTPRTNKSLAVQEAGGVGMILVNPSPSSLNADFHSVPTVHLQNTDYAAIHAYAVTASPTATINKATITYTTPAPFTAPFSSRGPLAAGGGDLLKPDVIAPGQDILTAVAPPGQGGRDFNVLSGTSLSAPHVAGVAALLEQLHPGWTPMMIKSALMTSASDVLDGPDTNPLVIFRQGAGHIRPNGAADPGLVYSSGFDDWLAFLCGATTGVSPSTCNALQGAGYSLDPSDLNVASIAIGDLAGTQTVTRKVTNVGTTTATYNASYTGLTGITTVVSPSSLTLGPGETKPFTVTFTRTTAPLTAYAGGQLTWTDGTHTVRIPMVVQPVALEAPAEVSSSGGPIDYHVLFGYTGPFAASARGLVAADTRTGTVADDPGNSFTPGGPGTTSFSVVVPAGTTYARFSLFDENVSPASDLDLYVFRGPTFVGASGGATASEEVDLVNPTPATYTVWVHGFAVPAGQTASFVLFDWALGSVPAGNMAVTAPASATLAATGAVHLTFSGLAGGTKYLGSVAYGGIAGLPDPTIVRVDTP